MIRSFVLSRLCTSGLIVLALQITANAQSSSPTPPSTGEIPNQRPVEKKANNVTNQNKGTTAGERVDNKTPIAPSSSNVEIGDFQSVLHARAVNINICMDNIVAQSALTIDRPHKAISSWVTAAPNEHGFNSIIGMNYPNRIAPNGLAVLFAVPKDQKTCEGQSVQIIPTSQTCTIVQAAMIKNGRTLDTIEKMPVIEGRDGTRNVLMPSSGGGCVVVSVKLH